MAIELKHPWLLDLTTKFDKQLNQFGGSREMLHAILYRNTVSILSRLLLRLGGYDCLVCTEEDDC